MSDFFLGEVRMFGFAFAPRYWALCNGATLSIQQSSALFALLGTQYGGNGVTTFQLPDLRGRTPLGVGVAKSGTSYIEGQIGGVENVTISASTMAMHNHLTQANTALATALPMAGNPLAATTGTHPYYGSLASNLTPLMGDTIGSVGGGQAHDNMQPFTVVNYCISLQGIFPSRG